MRIVVNTSAYAQASAELSSAQVFLRQALDGLSSGLAGAHQMAGNDDAGTKFANDYDEAASNLVSGITDSLTGAGVLSKLLADTANVWSDAEHNASGGIAPRGLASCTADTSDLSGTCSVVSPTALGGRSDFVPEGWEWVQSVVGAVWPNGDAGKLRSAQTAWQRAGDDLRSASWKVDAASTALGGLVTPELSLVQAKLEQYRGYLNDLSTSSHALGQGCTEYADGIEEAHTAIIQELQELLITTVAVEAGAALLAVFTLGASEVVGNAALMARIGLTGTRVAAMIARLVEVAAAIGARMAGITGTITRTVGMLREIKVIKTLTYLGTKAPAPVRAMTGIAFNSAVTVGLDAAANGGQANHLGADLAAGFMPFGFGKITAGLKGAEASAAATAAGNLGKVKISSPPFGGPFRSDYRKTFFEANPNLIKSDYVVHHAIEQDIINKYPNLFTKDEINSLFNLRGIPKDMNSRLHLSQLRMEWDRFYKTHMMATRQEIIDFKVTLDQKYGNQFNPKVE
jgi:hypothetical protein